LLGSDIVLAHAKDVRVVDGRIHHVTAGTGVLDYQHYLSLLRHIPVPLILHGLAEPEVAGALAFVRGTLAAVHRETPAEVA
jgi:sugar phosphate isomerase/epimerase